MLSNSRQSIQLDVKAFVIDNSIRRSILATRSITPAQNAQISQVSVIVQPGDSYTHSTLVNNNITFVNSSGPITMDLNSGSGAMSQTINSIFAMSSPVLFMEFSNPSSTAVELFILQA